MQKRIFIDESRFYFTDEKIMRFSKKINDLVNRDRVSGQNTVIQQGLSMVQRLHFLHGTKEQLLLK